MSKIMYLQLTDPEGYPPLINSSRIFSKMGWSVLFLGIDRLGKNMKDLSDSNRICIKKLKNYSGGISAKIQYFFYSVWCFYWMLRFRPEWIYVSDFPAAPIAYLISTVLHPKIIYHEHDSISFSKTKSSWIRLCLKFRKKLAEKSNVIVFPNSNRIDQFLSESGVEKKPVCVWNCASLDEVNINPKDSSGDFLSLIYCGSINAERLPMSLLEGMSGLGKNKVRLTIIGYETIGSIGYIELFKMHAKHLGIEDQLSYLGIKSRSQALLEIKKHDLGISFMPADSNDINMKFMAGASNKPFDYLSQGVGIIVSDIPEWKKFYVESECAFFCNPESPESIKALLEHCLSHPDEVQRSGKSGQTRILKDWNYECQFDPVLRQMESNIS